MDNLSKKGFKDSYIAKLIPIIGATLRIEGIIPE